MRRGRRLIYGGLLLHLQELKTNASSKPEEDIKEIFDNIDKTFK